MVKPSLQPSNADDNGINLQAVCVTRFLCLDIIPMDIFLELETQTDIAK